MGHEPFLLTCLPEGILHKNFQAHGFKTFSSNIKARGVMYFIKQIIFLVKFCKKNNIAVVVSHLQSSAIITGFARYFMKTKVVYMRHHTDYVGIYNSPKEKLQNWLANTFSPKIIAISEDVKVMLLKEGVPESKIARINLCYDFGEYKNDFTDQFDAVKEEMKSNLSLLYVARLDPVKRHTLAFEVVEKLLSQGIDCKLTCIGRGNIEDQLRKYIAERGLEKNIIIRGFVTNVFDYIKAADILLLISETEASSHMLKEAGVCGKTLIACNGVGDFNDYLVNGENGFLVDKNNPVDETVNILKKINQDKSLITILGDNLKKTVYRNFSIDSNFEQLYSQLFKAMKIKL
ncbi:glycosyltransferase [Ferruginibacter profundus]